MKYEICIKEIVDVDNRNNIPIAYCHEGDLLFDFIYEQFIDSKVRLCTDDVNEIIIKINNIIKYEYNCLNYYELPEKKYKLQYISDLEHCISQLNFVNNIIKILHEGSQHVLIIRLKQDL